MSKRCPECHFVNEDSRMFCSSCGSPLDAELRLIQDLEKHKDSLAKAEPKPAEPRAVKPEKSKNRYDDDDYTLPKLAQEKQTNFVPWIILGLVVVVAAVAWFMLK